MPLFFSCMQFPSHRDSHHSCARSMDHRQASPNSTPQTTSCAHDDDAPIDRSCPWPSSSNVAMDANRDHDRDLPVSVSLIDGQVIHPSIQRAGKPFMEGTLGVEATRLKQPKRRRGWIRLLPCVQHIEGPNKAPPAWNKSLPRWRHHLSGTDCEQGNAGATGGILDRKARHAVEQARCE